MADHIGIIQSAGWQAKKSGEGKTFRMAIEKPKWGYNLFDPEQQRFAEDNIGTKVRVVYETSEDGKYRNVNSIEPAPEPSPEERMTKGDWERKDILITRTAIAKSLLEGPGFSIKLADEVFAWVIQTTTQPETTPPRASQPQKQASQEPAVVSPKETGEQAQLVKAVKSAIKDADYTEKGWFENHSRFMLKPWGQQSIRELQTILIVIRLEEMACTEQDWLSGHSYGFANLKDATDVQIAKIATTIATEYADLDPEPINASDIF